MRKVKLVLQKYHVPAALQRPAELGTVLVHDFLRCDLPKQASAMAYTLLLSLIPSLVAIFCVISLFSPMIGSGTDFMDEVRDFILDNLASGSGEQAVKYLDNMLSHISLASIGWTSFGSVLVTLVLLLRQIEIALNYIWLVNKGRNAFMRFMYFWTFLTLGVVVIGVIIGASSGFDLRALFTPSQKVQESAFGGIATWLTGMAGTFMFFFILYKVVPNCYVGMKNAAVGAIVAALLLNQGGRLYGLYVRDAKSYQTLYGALAQLPLFLTWLYICWIIVLLGALISWRLQEGFPAPDEEEALDGATDPTELMRNNQVKAMLPMITLLVIYKNFQDATGKGIDGQSLAHTLRLPLSWVVETLQGLHILGYVVMSKRPAGVDAAGPAVTASDSFFPAYPASALPLAKLRKDLASPLEAWLDNWHHTLPYDLSKGLRFVNATDHEAEGSVALHDVLLHCS